MSIAVLNPLPFFEKEFFSPPKLQKNIIISRKALTIFYPTFNQQLVLENSPGYCLESHMISIQGRQKHYSNQIFKAQHKT